MKKLLLALLLFASCAKEKQFELPPTKDSLGRIQLTYINAKPYGWANYEENKDTSVVYRVCIGNVIWSIIGFETIVVPVWLTGWELYEPIKLKNTPTK